jgi:hypothetical protein
MPFTDNSFTGKHGIRKVACASQRHPQLGCSSNQDYYQPERKGIRVFQWLELLLAVRVLGVQDHTATARYERVTTGYHRADKQGPLDAYWRRVVSMGDSREGMRCRSYDDTTIRAW